MHAKPSADHKEIAEILIPLRIGITGIVENTRAIVVEQHALSNSNYAEFVDNQTEVRDVESLMIGPVFGHSYHPEKCLHPSEFKGEGSYQDIDHSFPIGIIQLINKENGGVINKFDKQKLQAIQTLIGHAIDNTQENNAVLNIRIAMYKALQCI